MTTTSTTIDAPTDAPTDRLRSWGRRLGQEEVWSKATAPVALVVLIIVFTIANPRFLSWPSIRAVWPVALIPIVLALGATFLTVLGHPVGFVMFPLLFLLMGSLGHRRRPF